MKKSIFCLILILLLCCSVPVFASEAIKIFINGIELKTPVNSVNENGTTLVPMRSIFEALGMTVEWDNETQTVVGENDKVAIRLSIGNKAAYVNGVEKELLSAPQIINGSTMVPIRFVSESTGCEVSWNGETNTIEIYSKVDRGQLYTISGEGSYIGYMMLKGYEDEDKYQIYFQGTAESFTTTIEDLRGIDPDEIIAWEYGGNQYRNYRKDIYGFFSDALRLKSLLNIPQGEELSDEWLIDVFGNAYLDWATGMGYSMEAYNLVTEYFKQTGQLNLDRDTLLTPDAILEFEQPNEEELEKEEDELQKRINNILESGGSTSK